MSVMWSLGHVYNVTKYFNDLAMSGKISGVVVNNGDKKTCMYENGYYICRDVKCIHIYRIQTGINSQYEKEPDTKIIEQGRLYYADLLDYCIETYQLSEEEYELVDYRCVVDVLILDIGLKELLKSVVAADAAAGFDNWDVQEYRYNTPMSELLADIDGGYGISEIELSSKE